jgi:REP-associated tyrosine transposase
MTFPSRHDPSHLYFVTATIIDWCPLFAAANYAQVPLNSLAWLQQEKRILLFAYVVLPSHVHAILKPEAATIGATIQEFGSFTAHEILRRLRTEGRVDLLKLFQQEKRDPRHQHGIWQDIQAKNIYTMEFLRQKMEYIHQNPVAKEWKLAADRADYPYSSAGYYDRGSKGIIDVTDINVWLSNTLAPRTAQGAR